MHHFKKNYGPLLVFKCKKYHKSKQQLFWFVLNLYFDVELPRTLGFVDCFHYKSWKARKIAQKNQFSSFIDIKKSDYLKTMAPIRKFLITNILWGGKNLEPETIVKFLFIFILRKKFRSRYFEFSIDRATFFTKLKRK